MGADKWEMRAALEAQSRELGAERAGAEAELHHVAEGVAPLALVTDLLKRTQDQAKTDDSIHRSRLLLDELRRRDESILAQLSGDAARQVGEIFERDHALRQEVASAGTVHDAQGSTQTLTEAAIRDVESLGGLGEVLERIGVLDVRINEVDRELLAVPTEGQLGPILEELGRERSNCDQLQQQHQSAIQEIDHISSTLSRQNMTLDRVRTAEADRQKDGLEDRRSREYAQKALESVGRLISTTVERNLNNIEAAILQRFHQLIGKKKLITAIIIDKETLEMRVATGDNEDLPIERLSAGERQLLATAAIWGLSTVAGRSIPLVVDTPLGRLDGDHRINLATNYFPNAAGQVIILSTDSEFTPDLYEQMRHAVGREYTLRFREENESSEIVPGYFLEVENAH
jgi:DNA sulfur modification protein DndD